MTPNYWWQRSRLLCMGCAGCHQRLIENLLKMSKWHMIMNIKQPCTAHDYLKGGGDLTDGGRRLWRWCIENCGNPTKQSKRRTVTRSFQMKRSFRKCLFFWSRETRQTSNLTLQRWSVSLISRWKSLSGLKAEFQSCGIPTPHAELTFASLQTCGWMSL